MQKLHKVERRKIQREKQKYWAKITAKHKAKVWLKIMALGIRDYVNIKVVQTTHLQGDVRSSDIVSLGVFNAHICLFSQ